MGSNIFLFFLVNILLCTTVLGYLDMNVPLHKDPFDKTLYEAVLDEEMCYEQTDYITTNDSSLLIEFIDAGVRTPRGILTGNMVDLGNYYQCLGINKQIPDSVIEGKYCIINVPLNQDLDLPSLPEFPERPELPEWPDFPWPEFNPNTTRLKEDTIMRIREYNARKSGAMALMGISDNNARIAEGSETDIVFNLAICIPKTCTAKQAVDRMFLNVTALGLEFEEQFCRLPNDKQWVAGDYVALAIFGVIGILTILSTLYDLHHTIYLSQDPKTANKLYQSFSVYTNTRKLVTYTPVPGTIECLDGLRSFAMMWVIIGHTFVTQLSWHMANPIEVVQWITSYGSLWITAAPITVDTFFMLSGVLLVYTTAGKFTGMRLIKNIHFFYLNRLLRMFPALAASILLQVSLFHKVTDGPRWEVVEVNTNRCRVYWWSTLLHIQNFVNPAHMCLSHSWYLAIDVQLHILSPIILFWVLGRTRRTAWIALIAALLVSLVGGSVYNFIMEFPGGPVIPSRMNEQGDYLTKYYVNTLPRAPPFFVGMIYGYLLHLYRGKKIVMSKITSAIMWLCATAIFAAVIYSSYPIMQLDWDNQVVDSLINSYMRPMWALAVGWMIFACAQGYGGPINWVMSLAAWKVLGRLSYAMYLVHYPLLFVVNSTALTPTYFSVHHSLFKFLGDFSLAVLVAFLVTVLVDSPCSILIKHFMGGPQRRPPPATDKIIPDKEKVPANHYAYDYKGYEISSKL